MKKILIVVLMVLFISILNSKKYEEMDDSIRFRVIANSNSAKDIFMKELIVDKLSKTLFIDETRENIDKNINDNLSNIENIIDELFKENNYNKKYYMYYGLNEIPEKEFLGKVYKKGIYKSLVIEIGEGKGDNYFCILYPSLCMIDYNNKKDYKFKIKELFNDVF